MPVEQPPPSLLEGRLCRWVLWLTVAVSLAIVWHTHRDYGPTIDEAIRIRTGERGAEAV